MEDVSTPIPHVTVEQFKDLLVDLYKKGFRNSVLLIGAPGIGKSEGVKQLAQALAEINNKKFVEFEFKWEGGKLVDYTALFNRVLKVLENPEKYFVLIDLRLTECEPTDLLGIPRDFSVEDLKVFDYVPFIWQLVASACAGILFLDEITNVRRMDVRSIMYKILRDRKAGWTKFHDDLIVIGAGNRPEDAVVASLLDAPVVNRVLVLRVKQPTVNEWAEYMDKYVEDYDRRVVAFLQRFPDYLFQQPDDAETLNPFPTPRTWTELAKVTHKVPDEFLEVVSYGYVGLEASTHLVTFLRTEVPDVREVLNNPEIIAHYGVDGKYLIASQLAMAIRDECLNGVKPNLKKFEKVLTWLLNNDRELLQVLGVIAGRKAMRKLHAYSLTIPTLRPVATFFAQTWKDMQDAGF